MQGEQGGEGGERCGVVVYLVALIRGREDNLLVGFNLLACVSFFFVSSYHI